MDNRYPPERNNRKTVASWPLIIVCFCSGVFIPVGIFLLCVRLNNNNKVKNSRRYSGHPYSKSTDRPDNEHIEQHYSNSEGRKKRSGGVGKVRFVLSLCLFFVGGIILANVLSSSYYLGFYDRGEEIFIGLFFVAIGVKLVRSKNRAPEVGWWRFIVSYSLFFVGGIIIADVISYSSYGGVIENFTELFVGAFFVVVGIIVMRSKKEDSSETRLYEKYANFVGTKRAVAIEALAAAAGVSMQKAYSDLQKMIDLRYFGKSAFIDSKIGYLLLDSNAYSDIIIETEEAEQPDVKASADEFGSILSDIRQQNDEIADPILSAQIDRFENVTGKIFRAVEQDPEKRPLIQKFLDYYLPTTMKLMKSYSQLEHQGSRGENINAAKSKIEDIMEDLVCGYERLLDKLYAGDMMDISSDIDVLETMMANDGYSEKNSIIFNINKDKK